MTSINVTKTTWSLQDDVIYNNLALVLYATGCRWNCKGCYNRQLWDFNHPDSRPITPEDLFKYILNKADYIPQENISIVGLGGDFWFQYEAWKKFTKELKELCPKVKIVWFTGSDKIDPSFMDVDAVLWGSLKPRDGKVYKTVTYVTTQHQEESEILINDYDSTYEQPDSEEELHTGSSDESIPHYSSPDDGAGDGGCVLIPALSA